MVRIKNRTLFLEPKSQRTGPSGPRVGWTIWVGGITSAPFCDGFHLAGRVDGSEI